MGAFEGLVHISSIKDLYDFILEVGIERNQHPIPFHKILFTLFRKGYLANVVIELNPPGSQFHHELSFWGGDQDFRRYHFFKGEEGSFCEGDYGGYCDLRPGEYSISDAQITVGTVSSGVADSYAFIPCRTERFIDVPLPEGSLKPSLVGFSYYEKNNKEMMCAQSAILSIVRYWQKEKSGSFSGINSAVDINRQSGVLDDVVKEHLKQTGNGRGLHPDEMARFFDSQNFNFIYRSFQTYTVDGIKRSKLDTDVYSYIESGFPVIAIVKTVAGGLHALTFIGHTFDKNSWQAMADVGYYGKVVRAGYHANTTWIENLIIQDDNFGPYYFFPLKKLDDIILSLIVPVPLKCVDVLPHEAADIAAGRILSSDKFGEVLDGLLVDLTAEGGSGSPGLAAFWLEEFAAHRRPTCGDGLILRSILRRGDKIIESYKDHAFFESVGVFLDDKKEKWFWAVELSWPDIYCFGQLTCGMILVDAESGTGPDGGCHVHMIHFPGHLILQNETGVHSVIRDAGDVPFGHYKPGELC